MTRDLNLPCQFIRACRAAGARLKVADSTGVELSGNDLLTRALIVRRVLLREVLAPNERYVGLLLPPSAGAVLANVALALGRRVAVNLNYTVSSGILKACLDKCGIKHVLTSRKFMEKVPLEVPAELIYLEDFPQRVTLWDKITSAAQARALPIGMLERRLGLTNVPPKETLTVIFTSGSTGDPKGVVLSQENLRTQIEAIEQAIHLTADDTLIGTLPFFHSYGYMATMWTVLSLPVRGVYHFSPLDAQLIGKLCEKYNVTVFLSTPTFIRSYLRKCTPEQFRALEVVIGSAEKLPSDLCDAFEQKFGIRPLEAYGCTEMSPLVAVNIPIARHPQRNASGQREGTVGRPIPGTEAKIVHPETGADLPTGQAGLLLVRGPNVMQGYYNQPDITARVIRDGWYVTGDIAILHPEGFIQITGRESRFSKIGGEMVPHLRIEEELNRALAAGEEQLRLAVSAVPDVKKGERIIVLYTELPKSPEELCRALAAAGLPNIWIPSPDSFYHVEAIPVLGTGKLDLQRVKQLAHERAD